MVRPNLANLEHYGNGLKLLQGETHDSIKVTDNQGVVSAQFRLAAAHLPRKVLSLVKTLDEEHMLINYRYFPRIYGLDQPLCSF
jgi:hypothetical protein